MKPRCVCIYGETCSGKSTLGKALSLVVGCYYISFGDQKRELIARGTNVGISIRDLLASGCPLPAELGYEVIRDHVSSDFSLLSGYPISTDELAVFSRHVVMMGVIVLHADDEIIYRRFSLRRECPVCHLPGVVGDRCRFHNLPMIEREDTSVDELLIRRRLYNERIEPFLALPHVQVLPRLTLDTGLLSQEEMIRCARKWLGSALVNQGDSS